MCLLAMISNANTKMMKQKNQKKKIDNQMDKVACNVN